MQSSSVFRLLRLGKTIHMILQSLKKPRITVLTFRQATRTSRLAPLASRVAELTMSFARGRKLPRVLTTFVASLRQLPLDRSLKCLGVCSLIALINVGSEDAAAQQSPGAQRYRAVSVF